MTPEPHEDGWDELRREIEALRGLQLPGFVYRADRVDRAAVLAVVDRLAATPPPERPAIDVERLARAMTNVDGGPGWSVGSSDRENAKAVAAEYDRLGSE